ncbi:MAG: hypothetical protein UX81_C0017G0007 [Parcubacteria group bacterium GW2011_GWA2_47_12]|nr:MAG: hypothetical protein UX81_C0017G0007 [Parcubacteria group bacterium GW2011_GWA2_47_12]
MASLALYERSEVKYHCETLPPHLNLKVRASGGVEVSSLYKKSTINITIIFK